MAVNPHWEYLFVHIGLASGFRAPTWRPYAINGEELPQWEKGPLWQDYFHQLGQEGWEFVAFDETLVDNKVVGGKLAIFKRKASEATDLKQSPFILD